MVSDRGFVLVAVTAAAGVASAVAVESVGRGGFPTNPVSAFALGAAAVAVWSMRGRAADRTQPALAALTVCLLAYLWAGVAACTHDDAVLAGIWSAGWIPVNGVLAMTGLADAGRRAWVWAVAGVTGLSAVATALLIAPVAPFAGLPTAAPESWTSRVPWAGDALTAIFALALLAATGHTVLLARAAHVTERRHLLRCAAGVSTAPALMVVCFALAYLRDPGQVDPSTGSVAYLVAIACCAGLAGAATVAPVWALRLVLAGWGLGVGVFAGVAIVSRVANPTLAVLLLVAVVIVLAGGVVLASLALERWATPPRLALVGGAVPGLSARENEILGKIAQGATNAGIAADLFLSERTVETYVQQIFDRLHLGSHDSSNRRVRAAVVWWRHQPAEERSESTSTA